jgi:transcriptional regulator with XRE-family HTH domain
VTVAEKVGRNLIMARRRAGLSQEQVAIRAEVHRSEVGLLEHGRRVARVSTLVRIAGAVEVEPADLLKGISWLPGDPPRGKGRGRYAVGNG